MAFCDRGCNVIAPFVAAAGNRNESPLLRDALPRLSQMARAIGMDLKGARVSLDGVYDCRANRKAIFNRGMVPNIPENPRGRKRAKRGRKQSFDPANLPVGRRHQRVDAAGGGRARGLSRHCGNSRCVRLRHCETVSTLEGRTRRT
ncbi:hypothetical protein [Paraburkholderia sp. MM5482-R1]|uniref:hypothetical protein n=1 Tax=unclassified Paraburkholderia TaxID=2615204 RepID=UPI003D2220A9